MDMEAAIREADQAYKAQAQTRGLLAVDADKEKAAQALKLQDQTGTDANMIYGNHEEFTREYKGHLSQQIIANDPKIRDYVNNYPMGAKISKDDWHNISDFNQKMDDFGFHLPGSQAMVKGMHAAFQGFDTSSLTKWIDEANRPDLWKGPIGIASYYAWGLLGVPFVLGARGFHAGLEGLKVGAEETYKSLGGSEQGAQQFARDFTGIAETHLLGVSGVHAPPMPPRIFKTAKEIQEFRRGPQISVKAGGLESVGIVDPVLDRMDDAVRLAAPYIKAGETPPVGLHPLWDEAIAAAKKGSMKAYDDMIEASRKVETKELSPDYFGKIVESHGRGSMHIDSDAALRLYGDKIPEPGDGLLGDVPGIAKQLEDARVNGTDIEVPWDHWTSKVKDEVVDGLRDDLRWHPGDMTLKEAEATPAAKDILGPIEEHVAGVPVEASELPEARVARLQAESTEIFKTHGDLALSKEGNLLHALQSVTSDKVVPRDLAKATRWALLNERMDIVNQALEVADRVNPRLHAQLVEDIRSIQINRDAMHSVKTEMAQRPLFPTEERPTEVRLQRPVKPRLTPSVLKGEHSFDITDQNGIAVASLEVTTSEGGKTINIDWIGRLHGTYEAARPTEWMLGPRNLKNLITDLMREFPNAETIAGDRVSGARTFKPEGPPEIVKIDLNKLRKEAEKPSWDIAEPGPEWESLQDLIASGEWERLGETTVIKATTEWTKNEQKVIQSLHELLGQIAPEAAVQLRPALEARMGKPPTPIQGAYISYQDKNPIIVVAVNALNPTGTIRHELVHFLRDFDFFKKEEWQVLRDSAVKEWIEDHNIINRYPGAGPGLLIEEAIAAQYPKWALTRETTSAVGKAFQKIHDLLVRLKAALKEIFGRDLTPEEIFTRMEAGEIGRREPAGPLPKEMAERAARPDLELPPIEEGKPPMFEPGVLGPKENYARYMRLINKINAKDAQKLFEDAISEEKKRQEPAWDKEAATLFTQTYEDIDKRPDFRVTNFLRNGTFGDEVVPPNARKIDPIWLTPEQKKEFPSRWLAKGGNKPDQMAGSFGYRTGKEMIDDIIKHEKARGEDKPALYKDKVVAAEVERRMRDKHGDLDENIIKAAREHAIGMEQFDLLHEETLRLGDLLGQKFSLSKDDLRNQARTKFIDAPWKKTELISYTRQIGKAGRAAETAFLKGDVAEAFRTKQLQLRLQAEAELAKKFEREKTQFNKTVKRFNAREPSGVLPEYTNWIHDIMDRVGRTPTKRNRQDIDLNIQRHPETTLKDFAEKRNTAGLPEGWEKYEVDYDPIIPIADFLLDPNFRMDINLMTVGEFRAVNNSIQALLTHGREEATAKVAGETKDRVKLIGEMVNQMNEVREKKIDYPATGKYRGWAKVRAQGRYLSAGLLQMEAIWERLDKGQVGLFTRSFAIPFSKAGNEFRILHRDYSRRLTEIGKKYKADMEEKLPNNIFREPLADVPDKGPLPPDPGEFVSMTRSSLRGVMLNIGNKSNLEKLAAGWGTTPEKVMEYVYQHATDADWGFARDVGKVYEDLGKLEDTLAVNMSGITVEKLPLEPIIGPGGKMIPGWYYPMVYDRARGGGRRVDIDINPPPLVRAMTAHGFERPRTNYVGPVRLDTTSVPDEIGRRLRNIAFREIITDTQKILMDKRFQAAMTRNLGKEYTDLLQPYLRDIAGMRGPTAANTSALNAFGEAARVNTIALLIGYNPGTVMKHTPTAYLQSFKELDNPLHLLVATKDLWSAAPEVMKSNSKWMMEGGKIGNLDWKGSGELQGRMQHWQDTLGGAAEVIDWDLSLAKRARLSALEKGAWMVAKSDLWASKTLFLAKYREVMEASEHLPIEQAHTEAVDMAERAVRRTHGSTAITSRPEFMRQTGFMWRSATSLYGFFNHIFNRYYRMSWKSKEIMEKVKRGEPTARDIWDLTTDFMYYVALPAYIEEMVTPLFNRDQEHGYLYRMFMPLLHPTFASMPIVREVMHATYTGHDPSMGILQAGQKTFTDMTRHLKKGDPFGTYNFGDTLKYSISLAAMTTGLGSAQAGRWADFAWNYMVARTEQPRNLDDWYRAFRTGTTVERRH